MVDNIGTEVEVSSVASAVASLAAGQASVFSSMSGSDFETKLTTLAATTNSEAIADHLDEVILLKHIIIQVVDVNNEATGEVTEVPRVILLDEDGKSYHAVSNGIFKAVENIIGIVGMPETWPNALPIKVKRERAKIGHYFTIELAI